mgnify:CR=1 FL=1
MLLRTLAAGVWRDAFRVERTATIKAPPEKISLVAGSSAIARSSPGL